MSILLLGTMLAITNRTLRRVEKSRGEATFFPAGASLGEFIRRARVRAIFGILSLAAVLIALLISHVSGSISARIKAAAARQDIAGDCTKCFNYRVNGRNIRARVLAQNDERTVLLLRGGVLLIETKDILAVFGECAERSGKSPTPPPLNACTPPRENHSSSAAKSGSSQPSRAAVENRSSGE